MHGTLTNIMEPDFEQCKEMIEKNANKSVLGKKEEKEAAKFLEKVEDVNTLLQELMSKDHEKVRTILKTVIRSFFCSINSFKG